MCSVEGACCARKKHLSPAQEFGLRNLPTPSTTDSHTGGYAAVRAEEERSENTEEKLFWAPIQEILKKKAE